MELKKILIGLEGLKAKGDLDIEIKSIEDNSKNVKEGAMFVAIKGYVADGHDYINDAIKLGAKAIVVEEGCDLKSIKLPTNVTLIMAPNTRKALAICSSNFYGNPSTKFTLIGVTGTKGKTTTTFMLKSILESAGKKVGLIGTICTCINGKKVNESERTTPESLELQKIFYNMVKEKVEYVVMEVSSQSLKLNRVDGCNFDMVIFTNMSKDHISEREHPDMEDYFNSKLQLLSIAKEAFVNIDNIYTSKIQAMFPDKKITTYGIDNVCDFLARDVSVNNSYVDFKVKLTDRNERVKVGAPGRFSVYNALGAICVAKRLGLSRDNVKEGLENIKVPGRAEMVENERNVPIMIDYAHSPESLKNILSQLKRTVKGRVICVFGCGGDRDNSKRPIMGEISGNLADYTIITSDNPRTEDPESIIAEIEEGIKKTNAKYRVIVDRKEAIREGINIVKKQDILVIAGKGHETYQEINGVKYPFDDKEVVKEMIKVKKK